MKRMPAAGGRRAVAEEETAPKTCPPHYWLITGLVTASSTQVWTCRRCALRKEVSSAEGEQSAQRSNTWRPGRPPHPLRGAN
jgi:hypothetical protein